MIGCGTLVGVYRLEILALHCPEASHMKRAARISGNSAQGIETVQKQLSFIALYAPNHSSHRLPFPEQEEQRDAGEQHIGAAFHWSRYDTGPSALEPLACHYAVLDREGSQQGGVDGQ